MKSKLKNIYNRCVDTLKLLYSKTLNFIEKSEFIAKDDFILKPRHIIILTAVIISTVASVVFNKNAIFTGRNSAVQDELNTDLIYPGAFINNYPLGGLTREQALDRGENDYTKNYMTSRTIDLSLSEFPFKQTATFYDLGCRFNISDAVEKCYGFARSGSTATRIVEYNTMLNKREYIDPLYIPDKNKVKEYLNSIAPQINEKLKMFNKTLDIDTTADMIFQVLEVRATDVEISMVTK